MLKRVFVLLAVVFLYLKADMMISPSALPDNIKQFISANFQASVGLVQVDGSTYEIYLSDGTELEFDIGGNFKEAKARYASLNPNILPKHIAAIIKNEYPNVAIMKIERKILYYEIKLSNNMELKIDNNGIVLSREFDD